ncbi:MAG: alpha/beta fold hydrolase [Proteobacteria bacterium]|nr:alpha/beta fold hydrolase [Pseudomonadota bacterium]
MRFALVPSPLLGPVSLRGTARALSDLGWAAAVADYGEVTAADTYDAIADRAAAAVGTAPQGLILVGHSGAGGLLAGIAARTAPAGVIFVDAILPHPGRSWFETVPPALAKRLKGMATAGRLPAWNRWTSDDPVTRLVADPAARAEVVAALPSVPVAYLAARAPDWPPISAPCAYAQLSETYAREAIAARAGAWEVVREDLHHLAMVTDPARVAAVLAETAETLVAA